MRILVLYVHPYPQSFNQAILEQVTNGLEEAGHEYEVLDLYAVQFDPVLRAEDFLLMQQGTVADDVLEHQKKVLWAQGLIIIHPIWWENHPAMLIGWIDRVLSTGFAYRIDQTGYHGLLTNLKKAQFIMTAGGTAQEATVDCIDICKRIFIDQRTLEFTGIADVQYEIFYNVIMGGDSLRKEYLDKARLLARNFAVCRNE